MYVVSKDNCSRSVTKRDDDTVVFLVITISSFNCVRDETAVGTEGVDG